MNNKLTQLFLKKNKNILNIYFTAGYPKLDSTTKVLLALQQANTDIIEIGMPYSDPIADGEIIQQSNMIALQNGMTIDILFTQLASVKNEAKIPIILMGYLNPVLQYGLEKFCKVAASVGVSGIILPDLPMYEFEHIYKKYFEQNNLSFIFLITPQTSEERILMADKLSTGFVYAVSSNSVTGSTLNKTGQQDYFKKIAGLKLINPVLIGFGINNKATFNNASKYAQGAIIGSAFISMLSATKSFKKSITNFVKSIKH